MKGKCKFCRYFNAFSQTYIKDDGITDCCAWWHIAYNRSDNAGERVKECFEEYNLFDNL